MPTGDENKCCRQRLCVTLQPSFQSLVLDRDALSVAIVGRMDVLADRSDFSNEGYRFAAYRQYILWQNGYLGGGLCHHVPHAPSGRNTLVVMGYIQDLDSFNNYNV